MCVYVCVWLSVYVCHDVCPDNLTIKDWCHTNNILQVHCWGCQVVQFMFHTLMTLLMTSPGHKVGQIFKLIYLRQYLSYSVDQKLKMSEMLMALMDLSGIFNFRYNFQEKSFSRAQNGGHFENFEVLNTASIGPQIWKDPPKLCQKSFFKVITSSMTSQRVLKFSSIFMFRSKFCKSNVSSINANIIIVFLGYTCQKTISMNNTFRDCRSKVKITGYWVTLALKRP